MTGVLPSQDIIERCTIPASYADKKQSTDSVKNYSLIENANLTFCLQPASYELRVKQYIQDDSSLIIDIPEGGVEILPGEFFIFGSFENVNLPKDLCASLYLRSSLARKGLLPWSQGFVDPGYRGHLTFTLFNCTKNKIVVRSMDKLCHIVFYHLSNHSDLEYDGAYQDSDGPRLSKELP